MQALNARNASNESNASNASNAIHATKPSNVISLAHLSVEYRVILVTNSF